MFFEVNNDLLSLFAVCLFLLKITLFVSMLNSLDLNRTLSCNKISFLFRKLPSLAVIKIFFDSLLIANFGSYISAFDKFNLEVFKSTLPIVICLYTIIIQKNNTIQAPIRIIKFLFIYKKKFNLTCQP